MKKLMALLLAVVFVAVLVPFAASARTLSADEQGLISKLEEAVTINGEKWTLPGNMITQAKNYLAALDTAISPDQCNQIKGIFDEAKAIAAAQTTGETSQWTPAVKAQILEKVNAAAQVVGLAARANASGKIEIINGAGQVLADNAVLVRQTGVSAQGIVIASVGAIALLAACAVVSKKVDLF